MTIKFCPICHKKIIIPQWIEKANIQCEKGMTITCSDKQCKGKIKFQNHANKSNILSDSK